MKKLLFLPLILISTSLIGESLSVSSDQIVVYNLSNHQTTEHCQKGWQNRTFDRVLNKDSFFYRFVRVSLLDHGSPVSDEVITLTPQQWIKSESTSPLPFQRPSSYDNDRFALDNNSQLLSTTVGNQLLSGGLSFSGNDMIFCLAYQYQSDPHYLSLKRGGDRRLSHPEQVIYDFSGEIHLPQNRVVKYPIKDNAYLLITDLGNTLP